MTSAARLIRAACLALLLSGCGGGDTPAAPVTPTPAPPPPNTPTPVPAFTLTVGAITPAAVLQGDSATATITVNRSGGFAGDVALFIESSPHSVTSTLAAASLPGGVSSTTVKLVVARAVSPGTYPVSIRAEATGLAPRTANLSLVVAFRAPVMTIVRSGTTPLITPAGGAPLSFDVLVTRDGVFGEVTFDVASGLPTGMTASFSPPSTLAGVSRVTLAADSTVAPGAYAAVIRASAPDSTGAQPITVSVPFTVTAPASISLLLGATELSLLQNGSGGVPVTIVRTNTTETFTLVATGQPDDVTVSFERLAAGFTPIYTVRFTLGALVPPGTYPILLSANVPSAPTATATINLTVEAAPVGGDMVFRFCGEPSAIPIWFGHGDVNGNWTRVIASAGNTFTFTRAGRNVDLAWVTQHGPDDFRITVLKGNDAERPAFAAQSCNSANNRSATGTVLGLAAGDQVHVALGPRAPVIAPSFASPGFSVLDLPDGPLDALAVRSRFNAQTSALEADRVVVQRALNPAIGGSLGALDFESASAIVPERYTLDVSGSSAGEQLFTSAMFHSAGGASLALGAALSGGSFAAVPESHRVPGDLHELIAMASQSGGGAADHRTVSQLRASPGNITLALGGAAPEPMVTMHASDGFFARFRAEFLELAEYDRMYIVSFSQQAGATRREQVIIGTAARTPTAGPDRTVLAPPFKGAPGWNPEWEPRVHLDMQWLISAIGWDAAGGIQAPRGDGVITRSYARTGLLPAR